MTKINDHPASFRDPSGFVFKEKGKILRQVNHIYQKNYDQLIESGLYQKLVYKKLLISHTELPAQKFSETAYKILEPEQISFISYPYEWPFSMLKNAALLTLRIQKIALEHNMSLKDATSFNIQFHQGRLVFIDSLSFEIYTEGKPWVAYKQFCEQFLAPLALMSYTDVSLNQLLQTGVGSIPIDLASKLLPFKAKLNFPLLLHIFSHAKSQKKHAATSLKKTLPQTFSRTSLLSLIDNLDSAVRKLELSLGKTTWSHYYSETNYAPNSFEAKGTLLINLLSEAKSRYIWDLGANNGFFSRLAAKNAAFVVALDNDPAVVEQNYLAVKKNKETNILPLIMDLTKPTPGLGWENKERESLFDRPNPDTLLALALIHHLAIANNTSLSQIAKLFSSLSRNLIIEFIPKEDSQVKILLQSREDIFPNYNQKSFEFEFSKFFIIKQKRPIPQTKRTLYLMTTKHHE